jgi:hypothetical protein
MDAGPAFKLESVSSGHRRCYACRRFKPPSEFYTHRTKGWCEDCKDCRRASNRLLARRLDARLGTEDVVYFIGSPTDPGFPIKIGRSRGLAGRLTKLRDGCPFEIDVLAVVRCSSLAEAKALERRFHNEFSRHRLGTREWFSAATEIHDKIRELAGR